MTVQAIRPAGAGYETRIVLAVCAAIVVLAALFIMLRTTADTHSTIGSNQVDARRGLTAAEQGIYADLLVAADEIQFSEAPPAVSDLADQMIAPFATDSATARRGNHVWQLLQDNAAIGYAGITRDAQIAGSLLLRLSWPAETANAENGHEPVQVWFYSSADGKTASAPASMDPSALEQGGWKKIVFQYDAGATRH